MAPDNDMPTENRQRLDGLTPGRAEEVASLIAEEWKRDWGVIIRLVMDKTSLSHAETLGFMLLREMSAVGTALAKGLQPRYHENCEACRQEKQFHEDQRTALRLTIQHLQDQLGDEWKDAK
jgi:hypothetical protein